LLGLGLGLGLLFLHFRFWLSVGFGVLPVRLLLVFVLRRGKRDVGEAQATWDVPFGSWLEKAAC
jgi:hypothetical protein